MTDHKQSRQHMVQSQILARGVQDAAVLEAMATVARELFVPSELKSQAYSDSPLPIGWGQTISQPYIVALMVEALALQKQDTVLEVGAGSGYAAAVIATLVRRVYAIERIKPLAAAAQTNLAAAGCDNVEVRDGDGTLGWPEHAPYDAILVSAGGPSIPQSLRQQLNVGGRLVIPVGNAETVQTLVRVTRDSEEHFSTANLGSVRFVPLIGAEGWEPEAG